MSQGPPRTADDRKAAADVCIEMLSEPSVHIRRMAVWELAVIGDTRAVERLLPMLHTEPDWECRHYVVMALGRLGDPRAVPALEALLESDYLQETHNGPAGPAPRDLAEHLRDDIAYAIDWAAGKRAFHQ